MCTQVAERCGGSECIYDSVVAAVGSSPHAMYGQAREPERIQNTLEPDERRGKQSSVCSFLQYLVGMRGTPRIFTA